MMNIEMLKNICIPKSSIKMTNFKIFYEFQIGSSFKKIIHAPTREKLLTPVELEQTFSDGDLQKYTDICFTSASRMQFLGAYKSYSANVFF